MKKTGVIMLALFLAVFMLACSKEPVKEDVYTIGEYTIDTVNKTIFDGEYTYHYSIKIGNNNASYRISYPDGSSYWWTETDYGGHGGWSDDYDETRYTGGQKLVDVLVLESMPEGKKNADEFAEAFLLGLLLMAFGALGLLAPRLMWQLEIGWRFKDAAPSDAALLFNRLGGVISVLLGFFLLLASF